MGYGFFSHKVSDLGYFISNSAVGVEDKLASEIGYVFRKTTVIINWRIDIQIVF